MNSIRILLADDHSLLRLGLASLLKHQRGLSVCGEAEDGQEAVAQALALKPDVVVMDLMMPVMNGVEATRKIKERVPNARILILTTFGTSADVAHALTAGASGAILKDAANDELIQAIRDVAKGKQAFSREISRFLQEDPPPPELTPRQSEILHSVTRGLTNREIAKQFGISQDCVKQHLNLGFAKIGAASRSEAVAIALRKQLLKI